jgi:hypothetical protein
VDDVESGKPVRCPAFAHAPRTEEGEAAWRVCIGPGAWRTVGMTGALAGLDWANVLARLDAEAPDIARDDERRARTLALATAIEGGAMDAASARAASKDA